MLSNFYANFLCICVCAHPYECTNSLTRTCQFPHYLTPKIDINHNMISSFAPNNNNNNAKHDIIISYMISLYHVMRGSGGSHCA